MANRNYREIQEEYLRRSAFSAQVGKNRRLYREYHKPEPVTEMIERLSKPTECGCHAWLGKHGTGGYAYIAYRKNSRRLHRKAAIVAYELKNGSVPEGKEVSHLCLHEWCVNPDHLIAETHGENLKRRRAFSRYKGNVCKKGHPLPPLEKRNKNGSCPICYREYQARWKAENRDYENAYREANKDKINARRRVLRAQARREGRKVT